ncbi:hypothetical protein OS493_016830 [Desmophyllum pertusum]|uniref:Uncharacterized protein n=1 Tax=Desmophyllum pertusum TaxID=174260 RepID=A0A9X0CTG5_9CNID|nr:hypothetical protein OS493_016830 [Desmophyllum pertusum]
MALKPVLFLISFFWLLKPCHGANKKCNETKCKLVIAGNDLPSEFGSKSTEDGVRLVYLNLKVGNNSYNPLQSYDKFQPNKWSWARNIGEPMLSFSYQYQVLSLGLLSNQVRNMEVLLNEEPTGCLANLTSSCKDIVVGRTLLQKIAPKAARGSLHSEDVVCVSVIKRDLDTLGWLGTLYYGNVEYHCCNAEDKRGNATLIQCELPVKESKWLKFFYRALDIVTIFAYLFWPDFLILLPDCLFKFENKENDGFSPITENVILDHTEIPVDDLSPITCPTFMNKCVQRFPTTNS